MRRPCTIKPNEGVLRPEALHLLRQLKLLEFLLIGNVLSDRALRAVPGIEHIPILYTDQPNNVWRARYRELALGEAERLTKDFGRYMPPSYIELGPRADAVSVYHEAVQQGAQNSDAQCSPNTQNQALRAERFAARLELNAIH
jgi:hypothetical protein